MKLYFENYLSETDRKSKATQLFKEPGKSRIKTFAIFTAENPNAIAVSRDKNKEFNKSLKQTLGDLMTDVLNNGMYHYYKVKGKYGSTEHSFLVYNLTVKSAKYLCEEFCQESFIFGINHGDHLSFQFWKNTGKNGYHYVMVDEKDWFNDTTNSTDNYTQISKEFKFTIPFEIFELANESLLEYYDKKCALYEQYKDSLDSYIEACTDELRTGRFQYETRNFMFGHDAERGKYKVEL